MGVVEICRDSLLGRSSLVMPSYSVGELDFNSSFIFKLSVVDLSRFSLYLLIRSGSEVDSRSIGA